MGMKKVAIVDDEYLIRELLEDKIDWASLGCEIVLKASTGAEVLDYIDGERIDLIITDINMPYMDGLEMARRVREDYPKVRFIVLTGYSDFEYARKGIEIGVEGFILKPIDKKEVESVIEKTVKKIDEATQKLLEHQRLKEVNYTLEEENYDLEEKLVQAEAGIEAKNSDGYQQESPENVIDAVNAYIEENMTDNSLTMKGTAERFYLNPSYLSRIYKKKMGYSFKDRLFQLRMEKAEELLKNTDMKVYEVGSRVGIEDPNYFSLCFKKFKNMSVSQYRKHLAKEGRQ